MTRYRRERPYKRTLPSGKVVWVSRYTRPDGARSYAKPAWNGRSAHHERRQDAQRAIDEAYELPAREDTFGGYYMTWTDRWPRSERTDATNRHRIERVLEVEIDGVPLGDWPLVEIRRRHMLALVDHLFREQGRAPQGVRGILSSVSAMLENAIDDELVDVNAARGVKVRESDRRAQKQAREIRVWSFDEMREFAAGGRPEVRARTPKPRDRRRKTDRDRPERYYSAQDYEALILTPGMTGLRLGEVLAIRRARYSGAEIVIVDAAHEGRLVESSDEKNHRRVVPVAPSLAVVIDRTPVVLGSEYLFPTPSGELFRERNFYRDVWVPAQLATGLDPTPHEFRHSFVTHLRAAGVDDADLADVAGHTVETMLGHYTHPLRRSHERIREVIG